MLADNCFLVYCYMGRGENKYGDTHLIMEKSVAQNRARYEKALEKGFQYNADENWSKAMGAFRVAISEFPKQPMPYVGLGEACFGLETA